MYTNLLNFSKSKIFNYYVDSLHLDDKSSLKSKFSGASICEKSQEPCQGDEQILANDLDMHSLISVESEQDPSDFDREITKAADEVIEEINHFMNSDNEVPNSQTFSIGRRTQTNYDQMLSLNAASLLNAARKSWNSKCVDIVEDRESQDEEYHSLPINLNCSDQQQLVGDSLNDSVIKWKATNIELSSKIILSDSPIQPDQKSLHSKKFNNFAENLTHLNIVQLNELYLELEQIIQLQSETLIQEFAVKDEQEFEKELKNSFISLLISVQNKRSQSVSGEKTSPSHHRHHKSLNNDHHVKSLRRNHSMSASPKTSFNSRSGNFNSENSRNDSVISQKGSNSSLMTKAFDLIKASNIKMPFNANQVNTGKSPIYLTTIIPYRKSMNPMDLDTLQMLIKRKLIYTKFRNVNIFPLH